MEILSNEEMLKVKGGAFRFKIVGAVIGGLIVFALGVVDGIVHPKKCN